jgi:hypothetical protein
MSNFLINVRLNNLQSEIDLLKSVDGLTNPLVPGVNLDANSNNIVNVGSLTGESVGANTLFADTSITTDGTITAGSELDTQAVKTNTITVFNTPAISLLAPVTSASDITTTGLLSSDRELIQHFTTYACNPTPAPQPAIDTVSIFGNKTTYRGETTSGLFTYTPPEGTASQLFDTYYNPPSRYTRVGVVSLGSEDIVTLPQVTTPVITYNGVSYNRMATLIEFPLAGPASNYNNLQLTIDHLELTIFCLDPSVPYPGPTRVDFCLIASAGDDATRTPLIVQGAQQDMTSGGSDIGNNNNYKFENFFLQTVYSSTGITSSSIKLSILLQNTYQNGDFTITVAGRYWDVYGFTATSTSTRYTNSTPIVGGYTPP